MKHFYYLLFLFVFSSVYGQKKFTVYFDTNSHQLNLTELNRLDANFKNKNVEIISVTGFCDFRATNSYNDSLSLNRANFVGGLLKKLVNATDFQISGKGENFKQNSKLSKNRKVEIVYNELSTNKDSDTSYIKNELTEKIQNSKIGDKLVLKKMNFYNRSDILLPNSSPIRDELLQVLEDNPKLKIEIQGHICCTPGVDKEEIALKRCKAIYNYLITNGIDKSRLSYKSFDATQPIYPIPEKNEEQRIANRRVEILIKDK